MNKQNSTQASDSPMMAGYTSAQSDASMQATSSQMSSQGATSANRQSNAGSNTTKNVIGIFSSYGMAEKAVAQLRSTGFTGEEINIISKQNQKNQRGNGNEVEYEDDDIADGTLTGGTIGGIGGLLLGAGALAIPGVGPILAAGPIAAAIGGAMAGGIAGGLIDWGIPAEVSRKYEKSVSQGDILAIVRTNSTKVDSAAQILRQNGAADVESH